MFVVSRCAKSRDVFTTHLPAVSLRCQEQRPILFFLERMWPLKAVSRNDDVAREVPLPKETNKETSLK
jgi:hypothetical protein